METLHLLVIRLKHWQVFAIMLGAILVLGIPLHSIGKYLGWWQMPIEDSPAPGIFLYLVWGIWLDTVLALGGRSSSRMISPVLLLALIGCSVWLKYSPCGMLIFLPCIALIAWVMVPAAQVIHMIEGRKVPLSTVILDSILVGCFFPFGVWILQTRLNAAMAK